MRRASPRVRHAALALVAAAGVAAGVAAQPVDAPALDVPYVPTPPEVVERMLQMGDVGPADFVIDLGSGDGRIAIAAARKGARALGVDIDPDRIREARDNAGEAGVEGTVTFRQANLFDTRIGEATVLTMYLLPDVNMRLRPRILDELKPGTRVVSHAFDMVDWKPDRYDKIGYRQIYMWVVPAKVAGRWLVQGGMESFTLSLTQQFQYVSGSASQGDKAAVEVKEGRVQGTEVRFALADGRRFHGRVSGERIESQSQSSDNTAGSWHAARLP
jgi:SAM-dependent methyltransferase